MKKFIILTAMFLLGVYSMSQADKLYTYPVITTKYLEKRNIQIVLQCIYLSM